MVQRSASSSSALPRFLLSLSASSTSSQQLHVHGPANSADACSCSRIAAASPPDSACRSTGQDDIELVALHPWHDSRILKHKRASLSLPALPERKSASAPRDSTSSSSIRLASRGSSASLVLSTTDSLTRGMTPVERQSKANQVWRGYW